jgi:hypothetical protein
MDLDVDIENICFLEEEEHAHENVQHVSPIVVEDEIFFYGETFVVQNTSFDKDSKKIVFERTSKSKRGLPLTPETCFHQNCLQFTRSYEMHWNFQYLRWKKKMFG